MKDKIDEKTKVALVAAAQIAGQTPGTQEFWNEVAEKLDAQETKSGIVEPR